MINNVIMLLFRQLNHLNLYWLGDDVIDIQHIESTAIPVIKAEPIIDIDVGITDYSNYIKTKICRFINI